MSTFVPLVPAVSPAVPKRRSDVELARAAPALTPVKQTIRTVWFSLLLGSICLEGLGRRYLPAIPSAAFYFLKDGILIAGLLRFRINRDVKTVMSSLYGRYAAFLKVAILWTFVEIFNPQQQSIVLGFIGLRAYWLWWVAPLIVASVLLDPAVRRKVVFLQAGITVIVAVLAILQFGAPVNDPLNTYSVVDGEESLAFAVESTGRARVSSTFSFISGFADFAILVPVLLLSIGLGEKDSKARLAALIGVLFAAAALPMSGSRGPFVTSLGLCTMVVWRAGLIFTPVGRRVILIAILAAFTSGYAFPDALQGVMDRFGNSDTEERSGEFFTVLPPVALIKYEGYPFFGTGTGMMQNYRQLFGSPSEDAVEGEVARYLWELGAGGYLLVWIAKFGLVMALWKSSKLLKKAGRSAAAASALAYAFLAFYGNLAFDHVYTALFFVGFGFILQEVVQVRIDARLARHQNSLPAPEKATLPLLAEPAALAGEPGA